MSTVPSTKEDTTAKIASRLAASTTKRQCRNVIIHGFCKFQDKGCEFNHDTEKNIVLPQQQQQQTINIESSSSGSVLVTNNVHAPVFVPKINSDMENQSSRASNTTVTSASLSSNNQRSVNGFHSFALPNFAPEGVAYPQQMMVNGPPNPYLYSQQQYSHNLPVYHKNPPVLPHVANLLPHQSAVQSFYIPDNLREQLAKKNEASILTISARESGLPEQVHQYHSLYPLEEKPGKILGHASWVYKATCRTDGKHYTMVRIEGFRLSNEQPMSIVNKWHKIKHSSIVTIREAFTTRAFDDSSLIFIYDYHPCSITLFEAYFTPQAQALLHARYQAAGMSGLPVPETTLWSFITQIASALKVIHGAGLSARNLEPNKILMTSKNRLRVSCSGLLDVLQYDEAQTEKDLIKHQQEDLLSFGKLVVSLACNSTQSSVNLSQSLEYLSRFYSPDLKNAAFFLLSSPSRTKTINELFSRIGPRILHEVNSSQYYTDTLEANLSMDLENSRILRLLAKFGFINERPEYDDDPRWQETGDRYMIKLFRDYLFHQVNDMGVPAVDMAHVVSCLNKLDAGSDEKVLLTSSDEQTSIVVSYKELKICISGAFNDINTVHKKK